MFMARWIQTNGQDRYDNIYYLFANTGQEHEKTLEFVKRCDIEWNLGITWLEAVINPVRGKGIRHKVVNFDTASRNGEPFEAQIAKEGIPNPANRKCSDRLKMAPMISYRKSLGYKTGSYDTAIGIRIDEVDRVNPNHKRLKLRYPLITDVPMSQPQIWRWWQSQAFRLEIPSHYGNCVTCWAKSDRKLLTILKENPSAFDFFDRMEKTYGSIKSVGEEFEEYKRVFFRHNRSVQDLIKLAETPFEPFVDTQDGVYTPDLFEETGVCGGTCNPFMDRTL